MTSHGHRKGDAVRIKQLIEEHQVPLVKTAPEESS
jgi:hypothetical protein